MPSMRLARRARLAGLAAGSQAAAAQAPTVPISGFQAWVVRSGPGSPASLILAVRTGEGVTGYGETAAGPDSAAAIAAALRHTDRLRGADAFADIAAQRTLAAAPPGVRAAVDIALLDLKGKLVGAPVYDLLAGRTRDKARALAALAGSREADLLAALAAALEEGFRAFSVPVFLPEGSPARGRGFFAETEARLERLRQAGAADLVLDCGGRTTAAEGAALAARLETFRLMWLDEPGGAVNDQVAAKVSHETVTPLAWGRTFTSNARFQDLLRLQVIDVLRPAVGLNGIVQIRRAAALAEAYYTAVAPFHRGGPIGAAAALQIAASLPNFVAQEIAFPGDARERRMWASIAAGTQPQAVDGFFELPTGPGLGVTVDEQALQEFAA